MGELHEHQDEIVAAYGEGESVDEITRRYDVTLDEIEFLVAQLTPNPRMPAPVVAASLLLALAGIAVLNSIGLDGLGGLFALVLIIGFVALLVQGFRRRNRGAQLATTVIGALNALSGLAQIAQGGLARLVLGGLLVGLLVVPGSSRAWFASGMPKTRR